MASVLRQMRARAAGSGSQQFTGPIPGQGGSRDAVPPIGNTLPADTELPNRRRNVKTGGAITPLGGAAR